MIKGSAGSGKSVDTAQQYILRLMTDKGRNLLCVRKAEVTNRHSTYAELIGAINRLGVNRAYHEPTATPLMIKCKNGNSIVFKGVLNDKEREKLKSITFPHGKLTDVWIEEITELSRTDFEIIDDRLRGILPPNLFYQIKGTFNPVSTHHWIKRDFFDVIDSNTLTHHSTYLNNRFVDKAYSARMERRKRTDPEGYQVYGLGEWGEVGGLILKNWEVKNINLDHQHYDNISLGQDFGFNHANALLEIGFKDGDIYILNELYEHEKDTSEIVKLADGRFPRNKEMFCDSAEPDRIKTWKRAGYLAKAVVKEQNSILAQIDYLKKRRIYIHPSCTNTIEEIRQWKWQYDDRRSVYIDEPVEFFDDAMAALRYGIERQRKGAAIRVLK